jgi:hypothetical protein
MPKYHCLNDSCVKFNKEVDFDTTNFAYYRDFAPEHKEWEIFNRHLICTACESELERIESDDKKSDMPLIISRTKEDTAKMLKKRSRDQSIPYNRQTKQFKEAYDRGKA